MAHRPLRGQILDLKKEDLRGGYSPPNPFTACHQRRPPSFPFPPSDPDDSKVVDVAVEEVEAVVVEEQGPDDSPPRPSSGSPKWQAAPQGGFLLNHRPRHISDACSHTWPYFKCQHCVEDFSDVL